MKKIIKNGTSILAAALVFASAVALAGCGENEKDNNPSYETGGYTVASNVYIVADETLHRGTVTAYGSGYAGYGINGFIFDCKNQYGTNKMTWAYDTKAYNYDPEGTYSHVCHECFPEREM